MSQTQNTDCLETKPRRRVGLMLLAVGSGGVVAMVCLFVFFVIKNRPQTPELTSERFAEAQQLWEKAGPKSYDIEISVTGRNASVYRVEVRDSRVESATRDGSPLRTQRTLGTWSVPGMFHTIAIDRETVEATGAEGLPPLILLKCLFHPQYGFPQRYHRLQWATPRTVATGRVANLHTQDVTWEVTLFQAKP